MSFFKKSTDFFSRPVVQWSVGIVGGGTIAILFVLILGAYVFVTPAGEVRATTVTFNETFSTTTYKDAVNTTGYWYGNGVATMAAGNVSSTIYEIINPRGGVNNHDVQQMSCTSATVCYLINEYNFPGPEVLKTTDGGTTWLSVHGGNFLGGTGATPYDIYALWGTDVVYVLARGGAGGETMVIKTTNGGTTWTQQRSGLPTAYTFEAITCSDVSTCVIAGYGGSHPRIYFTGDGGENWTQSVAIVDETYAFYGVDHYNDGVSSTYRAVGSGGRVYVSKSTTTPYVWTAETSGTVDTINAVRMTDYNNVYLVGGVSVAFIRKSGDAGANYAAQTSASTRPQYGIDCDTTTTSTCWSVSDWFESDGDIQKTTDGGNTWALVAHNGWSVAAFKTVEAVSDSIAYAAGVGTSVDANLVKTSTSSHFTNLYSNGLCSPNKPGCSGSTVSVIPNDMAISDDGQTIYAVGDTGSSGTFGKTTNGGDAWSVLSAPGRATSIDCVTSSHCVAVGSGGAYHATTNGGSSWSTGATTTNMNDVDMVTTLAGWVAINGSPSIIRTEDGGSTWLNAHTGLPSDFRVNDVWAVSTSSAFIAGYTGSAPNGRIYYTGDSGATWTSKLTNADAEFYKIHFLPDHSVGWAFTTGSGTIQVYQSTDGGATWSSVGSFESNNGIGYYTGIHFLDANIGFAATDQGSYLGITVNGGATWMRRRLVGARAAIAAYQNTLYISGNATQSAYGLVYKVTVPFTTSTVQSVAVDTTSSDVACAGITPTHTLNGGTITYQMSNDGGSTWTSSGGSCSDFSHTHEFAFASTGSDLRWRATLESPYSAPTTTPSIDALAIEYSYNAPPSTPTNSAPANAATNVLLAPTLSSSAFSDGDVGDTHLSSRWEVSTASGNYSAPIYATTSTTSLVSLTLPAGTLTYSTTYYWHVKHVDNNGNNSSYSTETSFTTIPQPAAEASGAAVGPANLAPPSAPIANQAIPGPEPTEILWTFTDTAANEHGFSILDHKNNDVRLASTDPIFTQDASELREGSLQPATEYCDRAVVAFNNNGNSAITDTALYPCAYTLPAPPLPLVIVETTPTTVTFADIPPGDGNPDGTLYRIKEKKSGLWLKRKAQVVAAAGDLTSPLAGQYELSSDFTEQTSAEWGSDFVLAGLSPASDYIFVTYAVNAAGEEAVGRNTEGGEAETRGVTTYAPVRFTVEKTVQITRATAGLAAVSTAADVSLVVLGVLALVGIVLFGVVHRRSGFVRCVGGICRLVVSPSASYQAVTHPTIHPVPYTTHRDIHRYAQATMAAALVALVLKVTVVAILVFNPGHVFGATGTDAAGVSASPGDRLTYTIRVVNEGPAEATTVLVTDQLPATLAFVPASITVNGVRQSDIVDSDAAAYQAADGINTVTVRLPQLGVNEVLTLTVSALVVSTDQLPTNTNTPTGTLAEIRNRSCVRSAELPSPTCSLEVLNPVVPRQPELRNANLPLDTNAPEVANQNTNQAVRLVPRIRPARELRSTKYQYLRVNGLLSGAHIADYSPTITGYAPPGDVVVVFADGRPVGRVNTDAEGFFSVQVTERLALGKHLFAVADALPNAVVKTVASVAHVPKAVPARAIPVGGEPRVSRETTPLLSGAAAPGSAVAVQVDGRPALETVANADGIWMASLTVPLAPGEHTIASVAGNETLTQSYTVDPAAAAGPESQRIEITGTASVGEINDPTPIFTGQAPAGSTVAVWLGDALVGSAVTAASGVWEVSSAAVLAAGDAELTIAVMTDPFAAGEATIIERQTTSLRINGQPPDQPTNDPTPEISGQAPPRSVVSVSINGAVAGVAVADVSGVYRFSLVEPLAEGEQRVAALLEGQELDAARVHVDLSGPVEPSAVRVQVVRLQARMSGGGKRVTVRVSGETSLDTDRVRIEVRSDPVAVEFVPPGPMWEKDVTADLDPGEHTVTATAYDQAGNASVGARTTFVIPEPSGGVIGAALERVLAVLQSPEAQQAATVAAPVIVTAAVVNTAAAAGTANVANFFGLIFTQPVLLFSRRRRHGFGMVYNSLSRLPVDLAIVRVTDPGTKRVVQTKVTDKEGRYMFFLPPGTYGLEIVKNGFVFPSQLDRGMREDITLTDVQTQSTVTVAAQERLAKNIPVDPIEDRRTPAAIRAAALGRKVQFVVAVSGPLLSVGTVFIAPSLITLSMAVGQVAAFLLFRRLAYVAPPPSFGVIRNRDGAPVRGAVVRVFENTYNRLLETQVTDRKGRYAFLVGQNRYYVTAEHALHGKARTQTIDLTTIEKGGYIAQDMQVQVPLPPPPSQKAQNLVS